MMNNTEEEEIPSSSIMYGQDDQLGNEDPLSDPLALDDNIEVTDFLSKSDVDTSTEGKIILVDVNSLRGAFSDPKPIGEDPSSTDNESRTVNKSKSENDSGIGLCEGPSSNSKEQNEVGMCLGDSLLGLVDIPDITGNTTESNQSASDDSQLNIQFQTTPITLVDEVNEEGEGARSDGSDSGFGLELSSSLINEKAIAPPIGEWTSFSSFSSFFFIFIIFPCHMSKIITMKLYNK